MTDDTTNTEQSRVAADCPNERLVSVSLRRWNFEADDDGLLVCRGQHESHEHCEAHMERLSPHEALEIINALRAECLNWAAKADALTR